MTTLDCKFCQDSLLSHYHEPIVTKSCPSRPFQQLAMDFAYHAGHYFLVIVDCLTDWPHIFPMGTVTTASHVIEVLRDLFCCTSAPDMAWSDGSPQFTYIKFLTFLKDWGSHHVISSPHYPQSNGKGEATVKSMKRLIMASWKGRLIDHEVLARSLLQYQNTQKRWFVLLYGHPVQDSLPAH